MSESRGHDVYSFDVFDTLVVRTTGSSPEGMYTLLGNWLNHKKIIDIEARVFAKERMLAGETRGTKGEPPCLGDIYDVLADSLSLSPETSIQLQKAEIEFEQKSWRIVPGSIDMISRHRNAGAEVALVSDMHLCEKDMRAQLETLGVVQPDQKFLVSCDAGATKADGGHLFNILSRSMDVEPSRILHVGNDRRSDYIMARAAGLSAVLNEQANFNSYEKILDQHSGETGGLGSMMAGASRLCRLEAQAEQDIPTALAEVAVGVAAPALVAYTLWVVQQAKKLGLDQLQFLSRDGRIMYEIAKQFPPAILEDLKLGYIHFSRDMLRLPATALFDYEHRLVTGFVEEYSDLSQFFFSRPLHFALMQMGVEESIIEHIVGKYDLPLDQPVPYSENAKLRRLLMSKEISEGVKNAAEESLHVLLDYLRQNDLNHKDSRIGMVDIGWRGQQAAVISAAIRAAGGNDPHHFHVGKHFEEPMLGPLTLTRYLMDRENPPNVENPVALFELFTATNDPGAKELRREGKGHVDLVFRPSHLLESSGWDTTLIRGLILRFVDTLNLESGMVDIDADLRPAIRGLLYNFWHKPTIEEVQVWGKFPFETVSSEKGVLPLCEPYTIKDIILRLCCGRNSLHMRPWRCGALVISSRPIRMAFKVIAYLRSKKFFL
ncbi:MAG: hypothetical protein DHS20C02_17740 [Micavibrio sp.]|nr:MAG: hypothetical protein DHS20C02_17740 [Micavibrio sp.]